MEVSPYEAASAVARLAQDDEPAAARLLSDYLNDGVNPLRLSFAMARMLAGADERISATSFREKGSWLGQIALRAAVKETATGASGG